MLLLLRLLVTIVVPCSVGFMIPCLRIVCVVGLSFAGLNEESIMRLEPERRHNQRSQDRDILSHLLVMARRLAARAGIDSDRQEDFAVVFAAKMLCENKQDMLRFCEGKLSENWLRQCARNALLNYLRVERLIHAHKIAWPQVEDENGIVIDVDFVAVTPSPHTVFIRKELRQLIERAIDLLDPQNADLVRQRLIEDKTLVEIAEATNSNPDALRKRLKRVTERLRSRLQRCGTDVAEVVEYLAVLELR